MFRYSFYLFYFLFRRMRRQYTLQYQYLKDEPEIIDGIGDCVVVLTNLAHLCDTSIEECIDAAYNEIKDRTGKMNNGTFKKD